MTDMMTRMREFGVRLMVGATADRQRIEQLRKKMADEIATFRIPSGVEELAGDDGGIANLTRDCQERYGREISMLEERATEKLRAAEFATNPTAPSILVSPYTQNNLEYMSDDVVQDAIRSGFATFSDESVGDFNKADMSNWNG